MRNVVKASLLETNAYQEPSLPLVRYFENEGLAEATTRQTFAALNPSRMECSVNEDGNKVWTFTVKTADGLSTFTLTLEVWGVTDRVDHW